MTVLDRMTLPSIFFLAQEIYHPDEDETREHVRYDRGWFPDAEEAVTEAKRLNDELREAYAFWYASSPLRQEYTFEDWLTSTAYDSTYRVLRVRAYFPVVLDSIDPACYAS